MAITPPPPVGAATNGLNNPNNPQVTTAPATSSQYYGYMPSKGQSYVDPTNGHVMTWDPESVWSPQPYEGPNSTGWLQAAPTAAQGAQIEQAYTDTGQVDPSWAAEQKTQFGENTATNLLEATGLENPGGGPGSLSALQSFGTGLIGAAGSAIGGAGAGGGGVGLPPGFIPTELADESPYAQAEMTAFKQNAADNTAASLKALDDTMASRGITGSGIEGEEAGKLLTGEGENLDTEAAALLADELSREQGVLSANATGANTYEQNQIQNALTARGQSLSALQGLLGSFGINVGA